MVSAALLVAHTIQYGETLACFEPLFMLGFAVLMANKWQCINSPYGGLETIDNFTLILDRTSTGLGFTFDSPNAT